MRSGRSTQAGVAVLMGVILCYGIYLLGCDGTKPTEPPDPEPEDYIVYCWDGTSDRDYFGYHPLTGVIDTFTTPYYAFYGIKASADGKRLYIAQSLSVAVVDLETLELITELPYSAYYGITIAPDNQMIVTEEHPGLRIISTADYSILYEDTTLDVAGCNFSVDSRMLYCCSRGDSVYSISCLDVQNGFARTVKEFPDNRSIVYMLPSLDQTIWYMLRGTSHNRIFEAYDVAADSVIFRHYLWYGRGDMVMTPDGRYVFLTEAGTLQDGTGPSYFTVYDSHRNRIAMMVSTVGVKDGLNPEYMPVGELVVTPDGRWLIAAGAFGKPEFVRFNLETMEIDRYVEIIQPNGGTTDFTCQCSP